MDYNTLQTVFAQRLRMRGIVADVARQLGLSHEHVRQTALGNRVSHRVQVALIKEVRRRERLMERERSS